MDPTIRLCPRLEALLCLNPDQRTRAFGTQQKTAQKQFFLTGVSLKSDFLSFTDPLASPTGFPFKVVQLPGTLSDTKSLPPRKRLCDLGYLRHAYRKADGTTGYRCPAEPVDDYIRKGGTLEETKGRECVCNGLVATIGLAQVNSENGFDLPLVTAGNEAAHVARFLQPGRDSYTAAEVVRLLLGKVEPETPATRRQ